VPTERHRISMVSEGVFLIEKAAVNCYLLIDDDGIILIDAGLPRMWPLLLDALKHVGATPGDIDAVLLTHGHFDHVGMCDRLIRQHGVPPLVHENDRTLARHPYQYLHERARVAYPFRHPSSAPALARMAAAGAVWIKGIDARGDVFPGVALDLPGRLVPVASPGHTLGHCGFLLPGRGILFAGDALVTLDPYTGKTGPRIVAGAATADSATALASLDNLAATDARLVLTGHGGPYDDGIRRAVALAQAAGPA
jgi:glyoxylase-like metal-dependent hydrolase (beta-lactamase superfamily II)